MSKPKTPTWPTPPKTGWPPGMLQDDDRKLSRWLSNTPGARRLVREACAALQLKGKEE